MTPYRFTAGAVLALFAAGCTAESAPEAGSDAALAANPDGQLAMASGLTHRPAEAGPITVYKTPT